MDNCLCNYIFCMEAGWFKKKWEKIIKMLNEIVMWEMLWIWKYIKYKYILLYMKCRRIIMWENVTNSQGIIYHKMGNNKQ